MDACSALFFGRFISGKMMPSAHLIGSRVDRNWSLSVVIETSLCLSCLDLWTSVTKLTVVPSVTIIINDPVVEDPSAIQSNSDSAKLFLIYFN